MGIQSRSTIAAKPDIQVHKLEQEDLPEADRILRLAFGTFLGLPDPASFIGDADYVRGRWRAITFQHGRLLGKGSEADTTVVYLVCDRPFDACW